MLVEVNLDLFVGYPQASKRVNRYNPFPTFADARYVRPWYLTSIPGTTLVLGNVVVP